MFKYLAEYMQGVRLQRRRARACLKYFCKRPRVLARTACLGDNVLQRLGWGNSILNHQKSRVDLLMQLSQGLCPSMRLSNIKKHLARLDVEPLLVTQKYNIFKYFRPDIFVMDSFSELTDQCFEHRKGKWRFYAHYSDVCQSEEFEKEFECLGLLPVGEIYSHYDNFFNKFHEEFPGVPIIFMHFPASLDKREKFRERAQVIKESLVKLAWHHDELYSFSVDESIVERPSNCSEELKDFPYHYSDKTYTTLVKNIQKVILTKRLLPQGLIKEVE